MKAIILTLFHFLLVLNIVFSQHKTNSTKIMFYNVENLFDTYNDTLKNDKEFLPQGTRFWDNYKYYYKLNKIYKVIVALGEWNPPAIIGLCEIENRNVLEDLTQNTPLVKFEYHIIHQESPDKRGIDVALLFLEESYKPLKNNFIPIIFPGKPELKTRDILYSKGIFKNKDTIHIFINHWPSRWGGQLESEWKREFVASVLKSKTDSILKSNPKANIIITGDFNDYPENKSIKEVLVANLNNENIQNTELYNLSAELDKTSNTGSHKYNGEWGMLDQFMVSGNLLNKQNKIYTSVNQSFVFNSNFLLEKDENYFGYKPFRTFSGYKYLGGFSDHLPVYIIIKTN